MAKRRRLTRQARVDRVQSSQASKTPLFSGVSGLNPSAIAIGMMAGSVVYVTYFPSDSVTVEKGDALWLAVLGLVITMTACVARAWRPTDTDWARKVNPASRSESEIGSSSARCATTRSRLCHAMSPIATRGIAILPWMLALWMMVAALGSSPPGNLRMATNEAWLWVTAACFFTAARILLVSLAVRQCIVGLLIVCGLGLSVHGMHQYLVSLPENRAEYQQDPESVLRKAMLDAPPGSAERMVFENRLMDGGPTATFALANSLAAVLLVTVALASGFLAFAWRRLHWLQRVGWGTIVLLCVACLMATRSRSATLAMLAALAMLLVSASQFFRRRSRVLGWGLLGLLVLGGTGTVVLALFGNREWFEQAPTSLAFRFQYWRATWQMVLDHPLFGAGPGNFQSIYERYREATTTEQIAEPHNFLVETLAAGGFTGLGLLLLLGLCIAGYLWIGVNEDPSRGVVPKLERHGNVHVALDLNEDARSKEAIGRGDVVNGGEIPSQSGTSLARWVWLGAIVALAMIWLLGWISRQPPDLDASRYVVPVSMLMGWLVATSVNKISSRDLDSMFGIAMASLAIHLMISGGWTVPGVAMVIWLCMGMLVRSPDVARSNHAVPADPLRVASIAAIGVGLMFALIAFSLRPVEQQRRWMVRAEDAQTRGQLENSHQSWQKAVEVDRWSADASLWLADFYRWQLVLARNVPEVRKLWEAALDEVKRRAGEDPAVYRMIGAQQLHVFQKHGDPRDLEAAAQTFESAQHWSPSNQWIFGQMALIDRALGNAEEADRHAARAEFLSRQGGNIERALSRQMVYIPVSLGTPADRGPVRVAFDKAWAEPIAPSPRISTD